MGQDSTVGITTRCGLYGLGIESRRGEIFRTRPDRPWGQPSLLYNGYRVSLMGGGLKWPEHGVEHPPHLAPRLKKEESYTSTSPLSFHVLFLGELNPLNTELNPSANNINNQLDATITVY